MAQTPPPPSTPRSPGIVVISDSDSDDASHDNRHASGIGGRNNAGSVQRLLYRRIPPGAAFIDLTLDPPRDHPETLQEESDGRPYDLDPVQGIGRGNRPGTSERFWYHPLDLVDDEAVDLRKNLMGVEVGYLQNAGSGPGSQHVGRIALVFFPAPDGSGMQLKTGYDGNRMCPRHHRWGYNEQRFSVYKPGDPRYKALKATDSLDPADLPCRLAHHNDTHSTGHGEDYVPSGTALLYRRWFTFWSEGGGWNGVKRRAQRVCMARDGGRWVLQEPGEMATQCIYGRDNHLADWREI